MRQFATWLIAATLLAARSAAFSDDGGPSPAGGDHPQLIADVGNGVEVECAAFSRDGRYLATGDSGTAVRVWDVKSGRLVSSCLGHQMAVTSVVFSADGHLLFSACQYDRAAARIWDVATGQQTHIFKAHHEYEDSTEVLTLSPDGQTLAAVHGTNGPVVQLWDVKTRKLLATIDAQRQIEGALAFSADGRGLVIAQFEESAVYDIATAKVVRRFQFKKEGPLATVTTPHRALLLTSYANTAALWDAEHGTKLMIFEGGAEIRSGDISPNGNFVVTINAGDSARLWDAKTGKKVHSFRGSSSTLGHPTSFSPDSRQLLVATGELNLFDCSTGKLLRKIGQSVADVTSFAASSDGRWLLVGRTDHTAQLWDLTNGVESRRFVGHKGPVQGVAFSPDGRQVATISGDGTARLWDRESGKQVRSFVHGHESSLAWASVDFSADSRQLFTAPHFGRVTKWDIATGRKIAELDQEGVNGPVSFAPLGTLLATVDAHEPRIAMLWDKNTLQRVRQLKGNETGIFRPMAFSADGRRLVIVGGGFHAEQGTVRLWDTKTGQVLHTFGGFPEVVWGVAISPDGQQVLIGSLARSARLCNARTGGTRHVYHDLGLMIECMAFSGDGLHVFIATVDGAIHVFSTTDDEELCQMFSFTDGTWGVKDGENRYDASNRGDILHLHWVVGGQPVDLARYKDRYFDPGLLAKKLGTSKAPIRAVTP